ncbi:hypothetical protein U1839_01910 [Sphingomonas sp. RT2P30]|uniref:hypothetical protein n=1 Tax=Parasphingomonas halimpatiens TaxID=3096162 RepID=UPI002FCBE2FD
MPYLIRYFRDGRERGSTPWDGSLDIMQKIAADGVVRHGMDRAVIADEAGAIVWSSAGDASDMRRAKRRPGEALLRRIRRDAAT